MKIAVVGEKSSVDGFKALGLDTFAVSRVSDAVTVWQQVDPDDYAVLFITEPVYEVLREELESLRGRTVPVITVIPEVSGSRGLGEEELRLLVERAVGTDVMFRE